MSVLLLLALAAASPTRPTPVARSATPPPPPPEYVAGAVYEQEPVRADYIRTFPDRAYREGVRLRGGLDCKVAADGRMEACTVTNNGPEGYGFEEAALALSKSLKLAAKDGAGAPVAGRRFRYWFHYDPPVLHSTSEPHYVRASECVGLAQARAEAAASTPAARNAAIGWTVYFLEDALHAGLTPAEGNRRLDDLRREAETRIAAGQVAAGEDERCWTLLRDGPDA